MISNQCKTPISAAIWMAENGFSAMMGGAFNWPVVYRGGLDPQTIPALKKN